MKYILPFAVILFGITACKQPDDPPKPQAPQAAKETVFDGMIDAKTRAKQQTEQAMEKSSANLEEAVKKVDAPAEQ
jgi:hypothetical protein